MLFPHRCYLQKSLSCLWLESLPLYFVCCVRMLVFPPVLSVVAGHGTIGIVAVHGAGTVILAMYTFIVGPWLPTSSVISSDLIHKQSHPMHLHPLCHQLRSNTLQKCPLFPCSYELKHQSVCSRCVHTCRKSRWPNGVRLG